MRFGSQIALILARILTATWAALAAALPAASAAEAPRATHMGSFHWQGDGQKWFGGLSGLSMAKNGEQMTAITDRGMVLRANVSRVDGVIADISIRAARRLKSSTGKPLAGRIEDSEGLAILADGSLCISFEYVHRVACYDGLRARPRTLPSPPAFRALPRNGGLEALAADDQGRLYAIPEDRLDANGRIPVFRWDGTAWSQPFTLPPRGRFLPVGADFGPDGNFYLLERDFGFATGFRSRLRRWDVSGDDPRAETVLFETHSRRFDNLEGLSVWRDDAGRIRATMISDDNHLSVQRTLVVEYALSE